MIKTPSRQLKVHWDRKAKGQCVNCGAPAINKNHCAVHRDMARLRSMNRYRRRVGIPLFAKKWTRANNGN